MSSSNMQVGARGEESEYASYCARIHDEEIYHDFCAVKQTAREVAAAQPQACNTLAAATHNYEKRDYVIRELLDTECKYVELLGKLSKCFMRPLVPLLKPHDAQVIFFGIQLLDTECKYVELLGKLSKCFMRPLVPLLKPHDAQVIFFGIQLLDTECKYVELLGKLSKCFMRPLVPLLKPHDAQVIFFGIQELHEIHKGLLKQLKLATEGVVPGRSAPRLADVFLAWREKLLIYGDYCSNLTSAQDTLKALEAKDSKFADQLAKIQKEVNQGHIHTLRDILSVPMQRVLKYHLLLDKLVHETQPNHEEFRGLERAKEAMVDVAQYINEVKRDSEVLVLLSKVQESIIDWDGYGCGGGSLASYGRLLLDGELKVKSHEDQKLRPQYVFVFDKLMLLCKPAKNNQYSFQTGIRLAEYRVEEASTRRTLSKDARWMSHFFLVRRTKDRTYTLYARTDDAKTKWVNVIRDAM
ncbi:unnamed protein product [Plutella xylostella]|uniref:(diamondback moth) hypothetical protein n=1 Tax=Plutella xylostella TaxID=51655 RepID=A0A8S4FYR4_PLUXY|nr:unnamed protein product [Plutella xylostella]